MKLPRNFGEWPRMDTDRQKGACLNCTKRLTSERNLFWCDRPCELEWRTRFAYAEWLASIGRPQGTF